MEDNEQSQFIAWLSKELEAKDDDDLQQKVQQLGEEGIKQAHIEFQKAKVKQYMSGGKLDKIKTLRLMKKNKGSISPKPVNNEEAKLVHKKSKTTLGKIK